jgi:hypothetical protein
MSKQKRVYATFGSTTLSVPEKMVGYDKQHHLHLWNTITPTHRLSHHYGKTAINLTTNPNSNRKIQRIPRTTKYMSYETKSIINPGLIQAPPPPPPPPAPSSIVIPSPVISPAPILLRNNAVLKIQKFLRNKRYYTRSELDAMSMTDIRKLLIYNADKSLLIAPVRGETSQRDRKIFNAYQRKLRNSIRR